MYVTLISCGGGDWNGLTREAQKALEAADRILGGKRLLAALPEEVSGERIDAPLIADQWRYLAPGDVDHVSVLYSGDAGFWSGARTLIPALEEENIPYTVLPGLSSVQLLSARLGIPWQDWNLVSAHGVDVNPVRELLTGKPTFFLTGGKWGTRELCAALADAGLSDLAAVVGQELSLPGEMVEKGTVGEFAGRTFPTLSVLLVQAAPVPPVRTPGFPDDAFLRGEKIPMTKQTVRAAVLAKLAIRPDDCVWDIGAGTGAVSVELALAARQGDTYAVERNPEALSLIRENRKKFCAWNLHVVEAEAPAGLDGLPAPDAVFLGGTGGKFGPVLRAVLARSPSARVWAESITLETLTEALQVLDEEGLPYEVLQLAATCSKAAGPYHLMLANNPVYLITVKERP